MHSIWLCEGSNSPRKTDEPRRVKPTQSSGAASSYLGVFTDDPAIIGRWLPRPQSPFVPAPEFSTFPKSLESYDEAQAGDIPCESPPADLPLDFGQPTMTGFTDTGFCIF
jgi:hypothetical protein